MFDTERVSKTERESAKEDREWDYGVRKWRKKTERVLKKRENVPESAERRLRRPRLSHDKRRLPRFHGNWFYAANWGLTIWVCLEMEGFVQRKGGKKPKRTRNWLNSINWMARGEKQIYERSKKKKTKDKYVIYSRKLFFNEQVFSQTTKFNKKIKLYCKLFILCNRSLC